MDWESSGKIKAFTAQLRTSMVQFGSQLTVSEQQRATTQKRRVKGPVWVSKFTSPPPKDDEARQAFLKVIDDLNVQKAPYIRPKSEEIRLEWIGDRKGAGEDTLELLRADEKFKLGHILSDNPGPGVIMFVYGGAFFANNQDGYRKITSRISRMTGMPCVTVNQRLAPQNPFPAALLDVFYGYLSLLAPPPGSPHSPMEGKSIVIAGDSSGACLALALLQLLLILKRNKVATVTFYGQQVELDLPAGFTLLSALGELSNSLPSWKDNFDNDWFPTHDPKVLPGFPSCEVWPSEPPMGNIYCDSSMLSHPLVSPMMSRDWSYSPPLWFACGEEMLVDSVKVIAQTVFSQGIAVVFQEYEVMPHIFMTQLNHSPQSQKCWNDWAKACKSLIRDGIISSKGEYIQTKGLQVKGLDLAKLSPMELEEARIQVQQGARKWTVFTSQKADVSKL